MLKKRLQKRKLNLLLAATVLIAVAATMVTLGISLLVLLSNMEMSDYSDIIAPKEFKIESEDSELESNSSVDSVVPRTQKSTPNNTEESNYEETKVYQFLKSIGYDDEACSGIMGNIYVESKFIFNTTQDRTHDNYASNSYCKDNCYNKGYGNAHGLVQWDGARRDSLLNSAIRNNVEWTDINFQFEYLKNELMSNAYNIVSPSVIYNKQGTKTSDKIEWVCYLWCRYFEVCQGVTNDSTFSDRYNFIGWEERISKAKVYYENIIGGLYD